MAGGEKLEADAATLDGLLDSDKEFRAPLFQRLYVWGPDEMTRLWDDIDQVIDGEDTTRFLGAIGLQDYSSGLVFHPRTYWLIDGQQRLTTFCWMLVAIAEVATTAGLPALSSELIRGYLLNQKGEFKG